MRVSTRIISGFTILLLLAFIALGYQLSVIHQMQSINRDLSLINFRAASTMLRMLQITDTMQEFSQKYFVAGDPIYERQLGDSRNEFLENLEDLRKTVRSSNEQSEVQRLSEAFEDYWQTFARIKNKSGDSGRFPVELATAIDHLQAQTEVAYDAVKTSIQSEVTRAAEAGQRAERWSGTAGVLAVVVSMVVAIVIVGAIHERLRRLTQGTHAIAKGQFWHRLPAQGNDEFSELARDFNTMSQRLGELDEMKKDFVSHVSHDLKAPLASMRQVMHVMMQEIPGPLTEQQRNLLRLSYNSAERLSAMVGNLLDMSRMEAGTMEYEIRTQDVVELIKSVAEEFEIQAADRDIRIRVECEQEQVFAGFDRDRIAQVIGNLLENALKFSPRKSEILIRVPAAGANGLILVSVTDYGPGVPNAHKDKIFLKFHQLKQGKKMAGQGVGLGLAICKTIISAHGGEIRVDDNPNGGSVFSFTLHAAALEEAIKCGQSA